MLLSLQGRESWLLLVFGGFEGGVPSRTLCIEGLGNFEAMRMEIFAIIEGRSRQCTLKTKYSQGSERGRFQNNNIPMRD